MADSQIFADLFTNIDDAVLSVFTDAQKGMSAYVTPVAWVSLGIMLLITAMFIHMGRGNDVTAFAKKLFYGCLIVTALSTAYVEWIATPLFKLPDELSLAVTNQPSATTTVDALADHILQLVIGVLQAVVESFKSWNIGGALVLLVSAALIIIAGCLLLIAVVFNMVYAKIGMAYLLGVGPLFIFFLMVPAVKNWFFSWLNTVFYFIMLTVFSTMTMLMFTGIANKFMDKLATAIGAAWSAKLTFAQSVYSWLSGSMTSAAAGDSAVNIVQTEWSIISISLQIVLVFIPLCLVAMETRTMVQSITGGSGGSFGGGLMNIVSMAWRGGIARPG